MAFDIRAKRDKRNTKAFRNPANGPSKEKDEAEGYKPRRGRFGTLTIPHKEAPRKLKP